MAKITITGNAVVVTSSIGFEDLKTIAKYRPEALTLKGGEDGAEPIYAVSVGCGNGELNRYGATFGSETHDDAKLATITMVLGNAGEGDIKEVVADYLGYAITKLNELEQTLPDVLEDINNEKAAVMESITVTQ